MKKYTSGLVTKFIFDFDDAMAETVLYKYKDRIVICCSVQCGCKVGCKFCGTGEKFVRNLDAKEIIKQVMGAIEEVNLLGKRFQIMFMSMGEPLHNWENVKEAIKVLQGEYPYAELLISTVGIYEDSFTLSDLLNLSCSIRNVGLQFSIHESNDEKRNKLIPYEKKMTLRQIRDYGHIWNERTRRPVYLNYCVNGSNCTPQDIENLKNLFSPLVFNFTFSVISSKDESDKKAGYRNLEVIRNLEKQFEGYNTRIFDPEAQDDIGGGCGQLWHFQRKHLECEVK